MSNNTSFCLHSCFSSLKEPRKQRTACSIVPLSLIQHFDKTKTILRRFILFNFTSKIVLILIIYPKFRWNCFKYRGHYCGMKKLKWKKWWFSKWNHEKKSCLQVQQQKKSRWLIRQRMKKICMNQHWEMLKMMIATLLWIYQSKYIE